MRRNNCGVGSWCFSWAVLGAKSPVPLFGQVEAHQTSAWLERYPEKPNSVNLNLSSKN